jgi:putative CocE/NonD family hydrolase
VPGFEQSFTRFPPPTTRARSWYLAHDGALADAAPAEAGADGFTWSPAARPPNSFSGDSGAGAGGLWTTSPQYAWRQHPAGTALAYVTAPLDASTTVVGPGAVHLWIRSSAPSVDLQATVSEVRPDGTETFVQNGWLRTSARKLDAARSTPLAPVPTLRKADAAPLPPDRWTEVAVPLYHQGHAYRAGSRIRLTLGAPGGDQPLWSFGRTDPQGTASVSLAHAPDAPSRLMLPVIDGVDVPTALPPCPGLRGQPCRPYEPFVNGSGSAGG